MASMEILFKATSEEAGFFHGKLVNQFPEEDFRISKLPYPTYNQLHCFEIRLDQGKISDEIRAYINEMLSGFSSSRI